MCNSQRKEEHTCWNGLLKLTFIYRQIRASKNRSIIPNTIKQKQLQCPLRSKWTHKWQDSGNGTRLGRKMKRATATQMNSVNTSNGRNQVKKWYGLYDYDILNSSKNRQKKQKTGWHVPKNREAILAEQIMFIILTIVMVSWVYTHFKTYQTLHFEYLQCVACQLHLIKAAQKKV